MQTLKINCAPTLIDKATEFLIFEKKNIKKWKTSREQVKLKNQHVQNNSIVSVLESIEDAKRCMESDNYDHEEFLHDLEQNTNVYRKKLPV